MKYRFLISLIALSGSLLAQPQYVNVSFRVNFQNVRTLQKFIDGVVYDGSKYVQIRHGNGNYNVLSGEHNFDFTLAIQNGTKEFKFSSGVVMVPPSDSITLDFFIADTLLPEFSRIAFCENTGPFFAEDIYDTLNCVDLEGRKQGIWLSYTREDGNCIDWLEYHCYVYNDGVLTVRIDFKFDYNNCEKADYLLTIQDFDPKSGNVRNIHTFEIDRGFGTNIAPGKNKAVDHNYFSPLEMKKMIQEMTDAKFKWHVPTFLTRNRLSHMYTWTNPKGKSKTEAWAAPSAPNK